jgi:hypothetical protein
LRFDIYVSGCPPTAEALLYGGAPSSADWRGQCVSAGLGVTLAAISVLDGE